MAYIALKTDVSQPYIHSDESGPTCEVSSTAGESLCLPFDVDPTPDGYLGNSDVSHIIGQVSLVRILRGEFNPVAEVNKLLDQAHGRMCWWNEEMPFVAEPRHVAIIVTSVELAAFGKGKHLLSNSVYKIPCDFYVMTKGGIVEFSFKGEEESTEFSVEEKLVSAADEEDLIRAKEIGEELLESIKSSNSPDDPYDGCGVFEKGIGDFFSSSSYLENITPIIREIIGTSIEKCGIETNEELLRQFQIRPKFRELENEVNVAIRLLRDVGQTDINH